MSTALALTHGKIKFTIMRGPQSGMTFDFTKSVIVIGRGPDCDLKLSADMKASREHAEVYRKIDVPWIKKISAKNQITVDNKDVDESALISGSLVQIGDTEILVTFDDVPLSPTPVKKAPVNLVRQEVASFPQTFSPPKSRPPSQRPRSREISPPKNKTNFYILVVVVLAGAYWLFSDSPAKKKDRLKIRTTEQIQKEMDQAKLALDGIQKIKGKTQGPDYQTAQAYYLKGFRDYRLGQFSRALQSFQAALSIYPDHVLAKKYKILAEMTLRRDSPIQHEPRQKLLRKW